MRVLLLPFVSIAAPMLMSAAAGLAADQRFNPESMAAEVIAAAQDVAPIQEPAIIGRVRIGEMVWVSDRSGREVHGMVERISNDGLVVKAATLSTFAFGDIERIRARDRDSVKNGTLIGLGIGAGLGSTWCAAAAADDSPDVDAGVECAEGFIVFPALGALIGLAVDAVHPGKMRTVYEAPSRPSSRVRLTIVPVMSSRVKGLAVSLSRDSR